MDNKIFKDAVDLFGQRIQRIVAIEELSELIKEICKIERQEEHVIDINVLNIAEEIADVKIVLEQLIYMFDCSKQVSTFLKTKLERLQERINNYE